MLTSNNRLSKNDTKKHTLNVLLYYFIINKQGVREQSKFCVLEIQYKNYGLRNTSMNNCPIEKLDVKNNVKKDVKNGVKNDVKIYVKNEVKNWDSFLRHF